jgi:hypothetical protein
MAACLMKVCKPSPDTNRDDSTRERRVPVCGKRMLKSELFILLSTSFPFLIWFSPVLHLFSHIMLNNHAPSSSPILFLDVDGVTPHTHARTHARALFLLPLTRPTAAVSPLTVPFKGAASPRHQRPAVPRVTRRPVQQVASVSSRSPQALPPPSSTSLGRTDTDIAHADDDNYDSMQVSSSCFSVFIPKPRTWITIAATQVPGEFVPSCMRQLKRIVDATSCVIVVSSTWRETAVSLRALRRQLQVCRST